MDIAKHSFITEFIRLCEDGFRFGWHEHNGGNLSYRLKPEEVRDIKDELTPGDWFDIGADVPGLGDEYFLFTGTGKHFRDIAAKPCDNIGIAEVDEDGERCRVVWGFKDAGPTSEMPAHLVSHEVKKQVSGGKHRVVYHCHCPNLMALTFVLPLDAESFTGQLWRMLTECPVVFPNGLGVIPWMVPGQREIAEATRDVMKRHDAAVWAHHGLFVSGEDFGKAFGLAHTIEKASEILVKVLSMGGKKQTITDENLRNLSNAFDLNLVIKVL